MNWQLAEPCSGLRLIAEPGGVWLRGEGLDLSNSRNLRSLTPRTRLGRLLPTLIPQMIELELAFVESGDIGISYREFAQLEARQIDAFEGVVAWSHFTIELESSGWPGGETFKYFYRFYFGSQIVHLERVGCFVRRAETTYRLDAQTFALVEAINSYNALPPEAKKSRDAFIRFAEVKDLAEGVGAKLDEFLLRERVVVPSRVGLDVIVEEGGRISFSPKIDGAPPEAMREAFLTSDDIDEVYSLDHPQGGRVRVVLDERQREVLRRMQRIRHLSGADRAEVLRDPHAVFDGVGQAVDIDPEVYGRRVRGIGDFPFVAQPYLQRSATGFFEDPGEPSGGHPRQRFSAGLKCRYADGSIGDVSFTTREEVLDLQRAARDTWRSGKGTLDVSGKSILVDEVFVRALDELVQRVTPAGRKTSPPPHTKGRYLLIYTNENELEYKEQYTGEGGDSDLIIPQSLKTPIPLMDHQREGIAWLQRNFKLRRHGRHGCLLADDMGLGKTLQVLTFLAWLIETGELAPESPNPEAAPWNPILIVAPIILLENEIWLHDMRTYFKADGEIFQPWLNLHGPKLADMRRQEAEGKETVVGEAALDLDRLAGYRVILTNYETVTNYQHSFASMKDRWTVVVTDEAQEYKTPSTKISHALKSLDPRFRVACTGTPVETRLLDVWNLFDFLQPGHLLGSAAEFTKKYEPPIEEQGIPHTPKVLSQLKERLNFGRPDAFVLRREKTRLPGLPPKHEHQLECSLSPKQREWHLDLLSRAHAGGEGNHPLGLLQQLMRLYQHPALVPSYEPLEVKDAIAQCPKLATVLECLRNIRAKGEKALIFTRSLDMQGLLATVIRAEFGLDVDIINGATSRRGYTRGVEQTRKAIVSRFRERVGFNVIVLSPDVAGIGLTLVEANHVIHYGRWWNPAKESQATDRVYRIGQTQDVHIYYPIAKDPQQAFETFDEKLDTLLRRRRELAAEFLAPMPSEDELRRELLKNILGASGNLDELGGVRTLSEDDIRALTWERFEALVAVLEERRGARVLLTPRAGDGGIDVIAVHEREIRLIQCKHTIWGVSVDANVLAEVIDASDGYRARYLPILPPTLALSSVLVTNGTFTSAARAEAGSRDVRLVPNAELWQLIEATPCTYAEIEAMNARRLASMRDIQVAMERLFRSNA